jgi:hypothetical protein
LAAFSWEDMPKKELPKKDLLNHVPVLVKIYGKWPSFMVLMFATTQGIGALVFVVVLHHLLR